MNLAPLLQLAVEVAVDAGQLLLARQQQVLEITMKTSATDPVTAADRASEALITRRLLGARPDDALLGEEGASQTGTSGIRWVVDPLDATVNFTYRLPHWCVSIAAEDDDGPLVGVVHDPTRKEVFAAARGGGATLDGIPIAVTDVGTLDQTLVATGFAYDAAVRVAQGADIADLVGRVRDLRRTGSAALDLAYVAAGRVDAYLEFGLQPWDWAAGRLLVTEAGGVTSFVERDLAGAPRQGLVAGGAAAHDGLTAWLAGRP